MEVNISRTARAADSGSREPTGAAPMTGGVPAGFFAERGLLGGLETVTTNRQAPDCFRSFATTGVTRRAPELQRSQARCSRSRLYRFYPEERSAPLRRASFCRLASVGGCFDCGLQPLAAGPGP